jgi:tripartite-type tricarboxylate transporter receptor subunit TctC
LGFDEVGVRIGADPPPRRTFSMGRSLAAALALAGAAAAASVCAQSYPSQPIKFVVPFTPGTGMDTIARTVGPRLAERLGQPVVVENRPGASGNIGADQVAKSPADGYTVLVGANTMLIAANLYRNVPFDPMKDFQPVSLAAWGTLLLVANPKSGIDSVQDLVAKAKASPGKITYSSPGVGTPHHMSMELFRERTGIDLLHVPYKGSAGALTDLLSGEVNVGFVPVHVAMPLIQSGKLRALAAGSATRHPNAPDVPTLEELGYKGVDVAMWYAFYTPKGTPPAVTSKLNGEIRAILAQPEVKATFDKVGLDVASSSPDELMTLMQRDYPRWVDVIRKNNIRAE